MKKTILYVVLLCSFFLSKSVPADAVVIVDTGIPPGDGSGGVSLFSTQWLAGEIALNQSYSVNSIEGWIADAGVTPGTLTVILYGDGGNVPDMGNELFSQVINVTAQQFPHADWHGVTGIDLDLLPGEYWVAFEVRPGNTYFGWLPQFPPNPLLNYAANYEFSNGVYLNSYNPIGIRVGAESTVIPEPTTLFLLGPTLLGLALRRKLFSK